METPNRRHWLGFAAFGIALLALLTLSISFARADEYELRNGQWVRVAAAAKGSPAGELELIRQYSRKGENRKVVSAAKDFTELWLDAPERQEVMKFAAEAEMARDRYWQAYDWWEKLWQEAPGGEYSERVLEQEFAIAQAFLQGKKRLVLGFLWLPARAEGQDIMRRLYEKAPGSEIAQAATHRLAEDYLEHHDYTEAADSFDQYAQRFPRSPEAPQAKLDAARATLLSYRGLPYDIVPLLEAQQRYMDVKDRYGRLAEQANVSETLEDIRRQRAMTDFLTGQYYEKVKKPAAAAFYYRIVTTRYAGTPAAQDAAAGLERLRDKGFLPMPPPGSTTRPSGGTGPTTAPAPPRR